MGAVRPVGPGLHSRVSAVCAQAAPPKAEGRPIFEAPHPHEHPHRLPSSAAAITWEEANAKLLLGFPLKDGSFPVGKDNLNCAGAGGDVSPVRGDMGGDDRCLWVRRARSFQIILPASIKYLRCDRRAAADQEKRRRAARSLCEALG